MKKPIPWFGGSGKKAKPMPENFVEYSQVEKAVAASITDKEAWADAITEALGVPKEFMYPKDSQVSFLNALDEQISNAEYAKRIKELSEYLDIMGLKPGDPPFEKAVKEFFGQYESMDSYQELTPKGSMKEAYQELKKASGSVYGSPSTKVLESTPSKADSAFYKMWMNATTAEKPSEIKVPQGFYGMDLASENEDDFFTEEDTVGWKQDPLSKPLPKISTGNPWKDLELILKALGY